MYPEAREKFLRWHADQVTRGVVFDFREELLEYFISEGDILRRCCMQFWRISSEETEGVDPFEDCLAMASA